MGKTKNVHIYMSVGAKTEGGLYVNRHGAASNMMNYRGVVKDDSEVPSFQQKMASKGHIVVVSDIPLKKHSITQHDGLDFVIDYPECFNDQMGTLFPNG